MRPLVFLTARSLLNGIKRSLSSARRLISLIAFVLYYVLVFIRPFERESRPLSMRPGFTPPSAVMLEAFIFAGFAVISLFLMLGVFGSRGGFRPADVDVLFPTPVNPRLVLIFRIVRDYLFTLLIPLLLAVVFYRPATTGLTFLFSKHPETAAYAGRVATVAWLLMALTWVCLSYAIGLAVNRSDLRSERNRKVLGWVFGLTLLGVGALVAVRLQQNPGLDGFLSVAQEPILRAVFFTATGASAMVNAALQGNLAVAFWVGGGFLALIAITLFACTIQAGWMYDQAATRGFDAQTMQSLQRQGDMIGMMAEHARRGKLKGRQRWLSRMRARGLGALVWKEQLLMMRSGIVTILVFLPLMAMMTLLPIFGISPRRADALGPLFLTMQGFGVLMMVLGVSQSGFIELLRRVDLQKPLPFAPSAILLAEVLSKVLPVTAVSWLISLIAFIARPGIGASFPAALILAPAGAALGSAIVLLMTVLFPDIDDPTQRGFRGLMTMLGLAIIGAPVIGIVVLLYVWAHPLVAALGGFVAAGAAVAAVLAVAGGFYARFNPSE